MPSADRLDRTGTRSSRSVSRRSAMLLGGGLLASSLAGCLDQVDDTSGSDDDTSEDDTSADESGDDTHDDDDDQSADDDTSGEDDEDSHSDNQDTENEESEGDETDSGDEPPEELIEIRDTLLTNASALEAYATEDSDPTEQSLTTIEDRLDTMESLLETLEDTAGSPLHAELDQLGTVHDLQRGLVQYYSSSLAFDETFESALDSWEEGDFQTAIDFLDDATDHIESARSTVQSLEDLQAALEPQYLDDEAIAYSGDIWKHLPAQGWSDFDASSSFVSGLELHLETLETLVEGETAYLDADFATAESRFETALVSANQGLGNFEDLVNSDSIPSDVLTLAIQFRADLESTIDALELFVDAATTAQEGNQDAADGIYEDAVDTLPE